jgi:tRNA(adenine34) deaminase
MIRDEYMLAALDLAKIAYFDNEVPVGAVVVKDNQVIGKGYNQVISKNSVAAHAEIIAINNAGNFLENYRLNDCDIYVTLEPCHMCAKAIVDARINFVYFGAFEPKTGAIQSIDFFFDRDDLNHRVGYSGGNCKEESSDLLKKFFRQRRYKPID